MDQASEVEQLKPEVKQSEPEKGPEKGLWFWFIGFGVILLLAIALGWFDNSTELSPSHDNVLEACFAIAGLSGLVSGGVAIRKSKKMIVCQRIALAFSLALIGFITVFMAISHTAAIMDGLIDFPPSKTRSYSAVLLISRAYRTHGKGQTWNIQTTPIWSNLDITEDDYNFMLTHRRVGDDPRNSDEISSKGYFCAQVTVQQSGNALRVMHAGSHKLPQGSVVICPSSGGSSFWE